MFVQFRIVSAIIGHNNTSQSKTDTRETNAMPSTRRRTASASAAEVVVDTAVNSSSSSGSSNTNSAGSSSGRGITATRRSSRLAYVAAAAQLPTAAQLADVDVNAVDAASLTVAKTTNKQISKLSKERIRDFLNLTSGNGSDSSNDSNPSNTEDGTRDGAGSPPPNCAICLGKVNNKCFTDSCMHQFCYRCLLQWSKVRHTLSHTRRG